MYLAAYHFDGDPDELLAAYARMQQHMPPETLDLHVCVVGVADITIFDACPSLEVHEQFVRSPEFRGALAGAGLPAPRIEALGEVHTAFLRQAVGT
jgi:hypothetical protein